MSKHIANRFDYDVIFAGFLKVIEQPGLYLKYKTMLEPELFFYNDISPKMRSFRLLMEWFNQMSEDKNIKPSLISFLGYIKSYFISSEPNKEAVELYSNYISRQDILNKKDDEGTFDLFLEYLKILRFIKYSNQMFSEYQAGNVETAADLMQKTLGDISQIKSDEHESFNPEEDVQRIIYDQDNQYQRNLKLGCYSLDNTVGGFEEKTLNLFMSVTNGGKSMMAHHLIKRAIIQKFHVHITCVEDRKVSFTRKIIACLTGIPIHVLKSYKTGTNPSTEERAAIAEAVKQINTYVKADFIYGANLESIHKIKKEYDLECVAKKRPIPIVDIIDYTGHISGKSFGDKMYEQMRNAYGERKDFALSHNKIAFDFAQVNREGSKRLDEDKTLSANSLSGSYDLAQVCDNIISINRGPMNIENNTAILKIAKARDGEVGHEFEVRTNFASAQFLMEDDQTKWLTGRESNILQMKKN